MQAVIMAAGKSTRAYPLTLTRPKPLLKAANRTILEHNLDNLAGLVDEVILIVGYKKEMIERRFGSRYKKIKIRCIEQKKQLGTGHAASLAEKFIKNRFILMAGDDIYSKVDIKNCIRHKYSILVSKTDKPQNFGVIMEKNGILEDFVEKPKKFVSYTINTSLYVLDKDIFNLIKKTKKSKRNEIELPDAIKLLSKKEKVYCIKSKQWLPIGYPWDLLRADIILRKGKNSIGNNSKIKGAVKNSSIGNNCIIKGDVKSSIVMDNSIVDEDSIVQDSIIGSNVYLQGEIISKKNADSIVKSKKIKIGRFGAVIADNVKARNAIIGAGCKIWPNKFVSGKKISADLI